MKRLWIWIALVLLFFATYFWQSDDAPSKGNPLVSQPAASMQTTQTSTAAQTKQIQKDAIYFTISKTPKMLLLSGTFTDRDQSRLFARNLRPTYSTVRLKEDPKRKDYGGMELAAKILPLFKKHFIQGEIRYRDGQLTLEGTVHSQKILDQLDLLLKKASIPLTNLTRVDLHPPLPIPKKRVKHPIKKRGHTATVHPKRQMTKAVTVQHRPSKTKRANRPKHTVQVRPKKLQPKPIKTAPVNKTASKPAPKATRAKTARQLRAAARAEIKSVLKRHRIEFLAAKSTLTPEGERAVDDLAKVLADYKTLHIEIAGHTDSDGSESSNQKLSQHRVDTVKQRLVSKGISAKRLRAKGYGESKPLVPNSSDANKQKNRRVEIYILKRIKI